MPDPPSPLDQVTPLILTYNEEANIARTLASLAWAQRIVVVDSGSTDTTLSILAEHRAVEVVHRPFDTHASQWNHGLAQIASGWVLSLDADYMLTSPLLQEMAKALEAPQCGTLSGFRIPFRYCVFGKPLRGTVLPPRIALFRRKAGHYVDDGHTQDLQLNGSCGSLKHPIYHDDRKPLSRWLWAQERYHWLEARKLLETPTRQLRWPDRLRKQTPLSPLLAVIACLLLKQGLLDGRRGWFYALQRGYAELQIWLMLQELQSSKSLLSLGGQ